MNKVIIVLSVFIFASCSSEKAKENPKTSKANHPIENNVNSNASVEAPIKMPKNGESKTNMNKYFDVNGDGIVTKEETEAVLEAMRKIPGVTVEKVK
jgi:hypothetical protein